MGKLKDVLLSRCAGWRIPESEVAPLLEAAPSGRRDPRLAE
jgi:hypothetical protein